MRKRGSISMGSPCSHRFTVFCVALLSTVPCLADGTQPQLPHVRAQEYGLGNVIVRMAHVVDAPIDAVYAVLTDPTTYTKWVPMMQEIYLIDKSEKEVRFHARLKFPFPVGEIRETVRLSAQFHKGGWRRVVWKHLYGDLRHNEGEWRLATAGPNKTKIQYIARFGLDTWLPTFLIRWAQEEYTPKAVQGLVEQAKYFLMRHKSQLGSMARSVGWLLAALG